MAGVTTSLRSIRKDSPKEKLLYTSVQTPLETKKGLYSLHLGFIPVTLVLINSENQLQARRTGSHFDKSQSARDNGWSHSSLLHWVTQAGIACRMAQKQP